MKNPKQNRIILTAYRSGRLYKIKEQVVHKAYISKHEQLGHRHLGHFHKDAVKKLIKIDNNDNKQESSSEEESICSTCILGKMKKKKKNPIP